MIRRGGHAAAIEVDLKGGAKVSRAGLQVHAMRVAVEPCNTRATLSIEGRRLVD